MSAAVSIGPPDCPRCEERREVWNGFLKRMIRCPACTIARQRRDHVEIRATNERLASKDMQNFAPRELPQIVNRIDQFLIEAVINTSRAPGLPPHLVTTDRTLERWYAAPTGMPAENTDVYHHCRPPPLDPRTQEAVSDVLKAAPEGVRTFIGEWYGCTAWLSQDEMARKRGMSRRQLGREWLENLVILRGKFLASPHADLVKLVRALP